MELLAWIGWVGIALQEPEAEAGFALYLIDNLRAWIASTAVMSQEGKLVLRSGSRSVCHLRIISGMYLVFPKYHC